MINDILLAITFVKLGVARRWLKMITLIGFRYRLTRTNMFKIEFRWYYIGEMIFQIV